MAQGHRTMSDIEEFYAKVDPWAYETTPDDQIRKDKIINALKPHTRALDVGCGEGWITKDLPAKYIFGIEQSKTAQTRFPANVVAIDEPDGKYDLIIATGVLYKHYDWQKMLEWIKEYGIKTVLTCNISEWEVPEVETIGKQIYFEQFPYREFTQNLRIFDLSTP